MKTLKILVVTLFIVGLVCILALPPAWMAGYVSVQTMAAKSPDGKYEASCRGRIPDNTEYDVWLRHSGSLFGRRIGWVGAESMGKCRLLEWAPDGKSFAAVTEGGQLTVVDAASGRQLDTRPLVKNDRYPTERIVTGIHFESHDVLSFSHCPRLFHATQDMKDYFQCGEGSQQDRVAIGK